jgi:YegS/Rv2252/BmrU family lipid kinase
MVEKTILLLINPLGNKRKIEKIVSEITSSLSQRQILFSSFTDTWPDEINDFKEAWIVGGDGTLNYFLNYYKSIQIPIVIFKGGTGNDFAASLYGKLNVREQINTVINKQPKYVDAAECNGKIFINGLGVGFDGDVLKSINAIRLLGGHLGYLWIVIKKIFSFKEQYFKIKFDEQVLHDKFLLVMVTNSTYAGGGFLVSPEAKINDSKLNMILCKPLPVLKRLKYLPLIEKGDHLSTDFIIHKEIKTVTINCKGDTLAQIDGELISASSFEIKVLPKKFLFKY